MHSLELAGRRPRGRPEGRFMDLVKDFRWYERAKSKQLVCLLYFSFILLSSFECWTAQENHQTTFICRFRFIKIATLSLNGGMYFSPSPRRCYLPSGIVLKQVDGGKWVRSEDFLLQRFLPSFSRVHRVCSEATEIGLETLSDFHNICFSLGKSAN